MVSYQSEVLSILFKDEYYSGSEFVVKTKNILRFMVLMCSEQSIEIRSGTRKGHYLGCLITRL